MAERTAANTLRLMLSHPTNDTDSSHHPATEPTRQAPSIQDFAPFSIHLAHVMGRSGRIVEIRESPPPDRCARFAHMSQDMFGTAGTLALGPKSRDVTSPKETFGLWRISRTRRSTNQAGGDPGSKFLLRNAVSTSTIAACRKYIARFALRDLAFGVRSRRQV